MILRRLATALGKQDWVTVVIETLIVVLGVFRGIQLGNLNAARSDRQIEAQYLARLQQELSEMSRQSNKAFADVRDRRDLIIEARDFFQTGEGGQNLNASHCAAIAQSHIYAGVIFNPPTIKELISTGRIVLIRDDALRTAILSFDQANEEISQLRTDIQISRLLLARQHPELIRLSATEWDDADCDFAAMATNQSFLNDFSDNWFRFAAYVEFVHGRQSELTKSLEARVAERRGTALQIAAD